MSTSLSLSRAQVSETPRIGPNAVLQSLRALDEQAGSAARAELALAAGLPETWPEGLIPEAWFVRLVDTLRTGPNAEDAAAVLAGGGRYTAGYVAAHRIPGPFKRLLAALPRRWAVPLLLAAFKRHAWTFAGAGTFRYERAARGRYTLILQDSPTCRRPGASPGGHFYEAAFEGLLRLASPTVRVREVACRRLGAPACRFDVHF